MVNHHVESDPAPIRRSTRPRSMTEKMEDLDEGEGKIIGGDVACSSTLNKLMNYLDKS